MVDAIEESERKRRTRSSIKAAKSSAKENAKRSKEIC